jgi:hypothetical protein
MAILCSYHQANSGLIFYSYCAALMPAVFHYQVLKYAQALASDAPQKFWVTNIFFVITGGLQGD